jgi:hypothetical protein
LGSVHRILAEAPPGPAYGQPQLLFSVCTPQQEVAYVRPSSVATSLPFPAPATASCTSSGGDISQPFRGRAFGHPFPQSPQTPGEYTHPPPVRELIPVLCADIAYYQSPPIEVQYPGSIPVPHPKPSDEFRGNGAYELPYDPRVGIPPYHSPSSPYWIREEGNESVTSSTKGSG